MKKRIISLDIARSLAIFGMIIVNFTIAIGSTGSSTLGFLPTLLEGKAAALFVVLAGVGIGLNYHSATTKNLPPPHRKIIKRAIFLFLIGLSYIPIWPADILHFYGIYMLITVWVSRFHAKWIFPLAILLVLIYPIMLSVVEYEVGWDFVLMEYRDFWSLEGFFRNLFINGFHPVFPWTAFMLMGFWLGKQNLRDIRFIKRLAFWSSISFILCQIIAFASHKLEVSEDVKLLFNYSPMPPLPLYMVSGISSSFMVIGLLTLLTASESKAYRMLQPLVHTGQLALTFYVAHVLLGILPFYIRYPEKIGLFSMDLTVSFALIFCLLCILFAWIWRKKFKDGPLESLMKKLLD